MSLPGKRDDERILSGSIGSPGLVIGTLALQATDAGIGDFGRTAGDPREALSAAVAEASAQLSRLAARNDATAGEILEFQIALLDDEALIEPAMERIDEGATAAEGWSEVLDAQIADYDGADTDYFRARAADLRDLKARVLRLLSGGDERRAALPADAILVADDLTPSAFLETPWGHVQGLVLAAGSVASHVATLARARGVPLLVRVGDGIGPEDEGRAAILDAYGEARLIVDPAPETRAAYRDRLVEHAARRAGEAAYLSRPAETADGRRILVMMNVDDPALLASVDPRHCDGIGLARTEFLFRDDTGLPDEEAQYQAYRQLLDWAAGRPVTVRTLDAGGDKPIAGLTVPAEANPFLGLRGIRLSLARPDLFAVQLRALARAAADGPLRVMIPMVTVPEELAAARAMLVQAAADAMAAGQRAAVPPLGIMVEVPAAALAIDRFPADFLSIGSNDLVQYVTATSRDDGSVAALHDPLNPGVIELIGRVVDHGRRAGIEVGLCGDMASDPAYLPALLDTGLDRISVSGPALARAKAAVAGHRRPGP